MLMNQSGSHRKWKNSRRETADDISKFYESLQKLNLTLPLRITRWSLYYLKMFAIDLFVDSNKIALVSFQFETSFIFNMLFKSH